MEKHQPNLDELIRRADQLTGYFQRLHDLDHPFGVGLGVARQWRQHLGEEKHDLDERRAFVAALEAGVEVNGSAWHELSLNARWWLAELEERAVS